MNNRTLIHLNALSSLLIISLLTGCAGTKEENKPVHQRGWIGGEYERVHVPRLFVPSEGIGAFPESLVQTQKAGILIAVLSTNTPARLAGLREGDLILELNHKPVTRLQDLRRIIDQTEPGTWLPVKAYQDGQIVEKQICAGRETFRYQGSFSLGLPFFTDDLKLWPNPGFSLVFAGYKPNPGYRTELGSVRETYMRTCDPRGHQAQYEDWRAWLIISQLSKGKTILSQETVPPCAASPQPPAEAQPGSGQ